MSVMMVALVWSTAAEASPYHLSSRAWLVEPSADPTAPAQEAAPEGPVDDAGTPDVGDPTAADEGDDEAADDEDADDVPAPRDPNAFNRHAIGVQAGLMLTPTWGLSPFLASHANALCRGATGNFASDRGLTKVDGCNFYVGGEYIYRHSRVLDIVTTLGYQSIQTPDGYWLDADEVDASGNPNLAASDYTEVDMSAFFVGVDFIARAPIVKNENLEFGIGGGAGLGVNIIVGDGIYQTPMGSASVAAGTCNTLEDMGDFTKCTPGYDPSADNAASQSDAQMGWSDPANFPLATCSKDECNEADLALMGRTKSGDTWPVYPMLNLITSMKIVVKDVWGVEVRGGWRSIGWFFGGAMSYHFGGARADVAE